MLASVIEIKFITMMILSWAARLALKSGLTVGIIFRQLIISIFVGYIAAEFVLAKEYEEWVKVSLFCMAVFLADDILAMVIAFGEYAKSNQQGIFKRLISILSGK